MPRQCFFGIDLKTRQRSSCVGLSKSVAVFLHEVEMQQDSLTGQYTWPFALYESQCKKNVVCPFDFYTAFDSRAQAHSTLGKQVKQGSKE